MDSIAPKLPKWNLNDLYTGIQSKELKSDLEKSTQLITKFRNTYLNKVIDLHPSIFGKAIQEYENIFEIIYKIMSYAQLLYSSNEIDISIGQFYQYINEKITFFSSQILFFSLEIIQLEENLFKNKIKDSIVKKYIPWLKHIRVFKKHQLSENIERILQEKEVTGSTAWIRLFDEILARLQFSINGKIISLTEALDKLSDSNPKIREKSAHVIGEVFQKNIYLFSRIFNTLLHEKQIDDKIRNYTSPIESRNLSNKIDDVIVNTLVETIRKNFSSLSHRYYEIKARWMKKKKLDYWDRNAPLTHKEKKIFSWDEACNIVLMAYKNFDYEMYNIGKKFFTNNWIDVPPKIGKTQGAFAHPTVPSIHPYLLLNFMGKTRDVMTLAHELGHGIHQIMASKKGILLSNTPLPLAETASVFGEMLTFQYMLNLTNSLEERKILLSTKVEDILNTVIRQISFHTFEYQIHLERKKGEISPQRFGEIWLNVQKESLGPIFNFHKSYETYWCYISHFIHAPFYVYSYAFGDCLVNSLYEIYQKGIFINFQEKYRNMLYAGGTLKYSEILAPFNLNPSDPYFWERGLNLLKNLLNELENID